MKSSRRLGLVLLIVAVAGIGYFAFNRGQRPTPDSPQYAEIVSAFYVGLGALESGEKRAPEKFKRLTELAPAEPAGWANLGLVQLRNNELEEAAQNLEKARALAPGNAEIEALSGLIESRRGNSEEAIKHFRRAIELSPDNLWNLTALAEELERQENTAEAIKVLDTILEKAPDNLKAHLNRARLAAKTGDAKTLKEQIAWLEKQRANWPPIAEEMFGTLKAAQGTPARASIETIRLENVLKAEERYQNDLSLLAPPQNQLGQPLQRMLSFPPQSGQPAPPDMQTSFKATPINATGKWQIARVYYADGETPPEALLGRLNEWRLASGKTYPFPGKPGAALPVDYDYDFKNDIALAGSKGFRLWRASENGFSDVTSKTKLPPDVLNGNYIGAWAGDIEMDGDLDIILADKDDTPVLRNNGDGTFKLLRPFGKINAIKDFAWADIDDDGDPDAVFAGKKLQVFTNERSGVFKEITAPREMAEQMSIEVADANRDGHLEILVAAAGDPLAALTWDGTAWKRQDILGKEASSQDKRMFVADLDNNGAMDIVLSDESSKIWLGAEKDAFVPLEKPLDFAVYGTADQNKDGLLDLLALDKNGTPQWLINSGSKKYHWLNLRPLAQSGNVEGDGRINSFGIGGEVSVRSGLLYQKQVIQEPLVHFGLGEKENVEIARIVWPNGDPRAEFDLKGDANITALQRLTGSCPYLFAWNGEKMAFVTDCIWRSPLGLKINAQDTAGSMQTEDWLKLRGDQLKPKDGKLNLSITAELWETHFFDHLALMSVDHPPGTEIWVDERLAFPQPLLKVYASKAPVAVKAWDDEGRDVSQIIKARDGNYLDNFGRGRYQGVTRDHWVEIEVPQELLPINRQLAGQMPPLYLIAQGWIHPTDSSLNVAIGQGNHTPPQGLRLEVLDAKGKWVVAKPGLGFPEGKLKTVVIRLDDVVKGKQNRVRLRTNLEIFWDSLAVAEGLPDAKFQTQRLKLERADLRYRGFSEIKAADASSPELPTSYEKIQTTNQKWRDLIGYYTRFGDVQELLKGVDDRYVIMNAGDEMQLSWNNPAPPPADWVRDWVFIGDGWVKDGNFNTTWSKTVIPLPAHDRPDYTTPPKDLWSDPVYLQHKSDWELYHTRYVTPKAFQNVLRPRLSRAQ
ncbi:MAG TPA: FG-GAP-like repeat-containing protein [Abditibacteriaceae bacterium]|jgi:tetratricopeptide (TPR) repeat protein